MRLYTIHNLATDIIAFAGDETGKSRYTTVVRAIRASLNELNVVGMPTAKTEVFKVGSNMTFKMPKSCIDIHKVGMLTTNGKLRLFRRRKRIYNNRLMTELIEEEDIICDDQDDSNATGAVSLDDVGVLTQSTTHSMEAYATFHNYTGTDYFGEVFGYSPTPGRFGYFEYDLKRNRIVVGGYGVSEGVIIFVEYKPSVETSDYQLLPIDTYQMIRYRAMQILTENGNVRQGMYNFDQFRRSYRNYKESHQHWDLNEIVDAVRGNYRRAIKR
jgi:hypothetical protein